MAWKARLVDDFSMQSGLVAARYCEGGDTKSFVTALTFVSLKEGEAFPADFQFLRGRDATAFLQAMMDAAYDAGLRPSRAQDERHLKAHLEDMRQIAFHTVIGRARGPNETMAD